MKALAKDPRYKFAEGDKGRAEIMAFIQDRLDWIRAQMPRAFNTLVKPNMEVKRLPPEEEPGAPGAYGGAGSIDGKIPGRFWINLQDDRSAQQVQPGGPDVPRVDPRPHLAGRIHAQDAARSARCSPSTPTPKAGRSTPSSSPTSSAPTTSDPVGRLGYLQSIAFRACRLVVDTGIHAKRWTREQGVKFFVDVNGSNPEEVASEVDRYCSWPGQACGYKVGHSEINRQRERAKTALGAKYDLKAFDDTVVLGGNVPLDVLAKNVEEYIRAAQG